MAQTSWIHSGWNYTEFFRQDYTELEKKEMKSVVEALANQQKTELEIMFAMHELHQIHMSIDTIRTCNKHHWQLGCIKKSRRRKEYTPKKREEIEPTLRRCQTQGLSNLQTAFFIFEKHGFMADQVFYGKQARKERRPSDLGNGQHCPSYRKRSESTQSTAADPGPPWKKSHSSSTSKSAIEVDHIDHPLVNAWLYVDQSRAMPVQWEVDAVYDEDEIGFEHDAHYVMQPNQNLNFDSPNYPQYPSSQDFAGLSFSPLYLDDHLCHADDNFNHVIGDCPTGQHNIIADTRVSSNHGEYDALDMAENLIDGLVQQPLQSTDATRNEQDLIYLIQDYFVWIARRNATMHNITNFDQKTLDEIEERPWQFYGRCYNGYKDLMSKAPQERQRGEKLLNCGKEIAFRAFERPNKRLMPCIFFYYFIACADIEPSEHKKFTTLLYKHAQTMDSLGWSHPLTRILGILSKTDNFYKNARTRIVKAIADALENCWDTDYHAAYEAHELLVIMYMAQGDFNRAHECCDTMIERPHKLDISYILRARRAKGRIFFNQKDFSTARIIFESIKCIWENTGRLTVSSKEYMVWENLARLEQAENNPELAKQYWQMAKIYSDSSYTTGSNSARIAREGKLEEAFANMNIEDDESSEGLRLSEITAIHLGTNV